MSTTRRAMDALAVQLMLLLSVIWGLQQISIKLAAPDMAPLLQVGLRSLLAVPLVVLFMLWRRQPFAWRDGTLRDGLVLGLLFAVEFLCVAEGLRYSSAAHIVVLLYTAPIFAALGLHLLLPGERLRPLQWLGILLAFAGTLLAFARTLLDGEASADMLLGDLFGLLSGLFWAALIVWVRCSRLADAPPAKALLFQLLGAAILLPLAALLSGQASTFSLTPTVIWALLFQGVVVAFASYLAWFWLLRQYNASQLGAFSFMTPLFGVLFGIGLLGEQVDGLFLAGGLLVLLGISLVSAHAWWRRLLLSRAG
ncbi:DMT family transporter [Pseudomonas sp. NW5]|uniref:DMT family transporter n=1 Tax=Pseudomonas sp. NW5 TaxID=2934934 RepID=UPI0020213543|nr:DMT family transporter [Pseudomonas sp. NW5]MCL7462629.1 DMT family transporter [Pseudomonas sp. NW5]